jgi:RND superfamily putative drug exporter
MFTRLAALATARPRRLAALGLLAFIAMAVFGAPAIGKLKAPNAFNDPGSQSALAQAQVQDATGHDAYPEILALVKAPPSSGEVTSVARVLRADPAVAAVIVAPGASSPLVSRDGQQTLIPVVLRAGVNSDDVVKRLTGDFRSDHAVALGGDAVAGRQSGQQATKDLGLAEAITFPLLVLLSLLIFRGLAALLPLAVGAITVFGAFTVLRLVNFGLPLSPFALNLVIGLGLGLAVDYSLLFVSRFREELSRPGATAGGALAATLGSAGRTVGFSAVTVAAAMACLTVFPQRFLVSMGIGGAATALVAAAVTFLLLPALLVLLASRLGKVRPVPDGTGRWHALARGVTRRPGLSALAGLALMALFAAPAIGLHWTGIDATVLPASQSARVVADTVSADFPGTGTSPLVVAVTAPAGAAQAVNGYARELRGVSGVESVTQPQDLGHGTWEVTVAVRGDAASASAQSLVGQVRAQPAPFPVAVGGAAANLADQHAAVIKALPVALPLLAALTLLALWLMTGSLALPALALLTNVATVAAATGIVKFAFQDGYLTFGAARQAGVEQTNYMVLAAIVFGLSTDYGVFLLTRMKEAHDSGLPDRDAIATGIQRTGAIVSAAAILLAVAVGAFLTANVVFLKEIGLGGAMAVLIDAFIVRATLAPAMMALLGRAAWWSPRALHRLHGRIGISEAPRQLPRPQPVPSGGSPG